MGEGWHLEFQVFEFETGNDARLVEQEVTRSRGRMRRGPEMDFGWEENDFKYMPKKVDKWRVGKNTCGS